MNIKFERGRDHDMDVIEGSKKPELKVEKKVADTDAGDKKVIEKAEKLRLQGILDEAGVTYAKTLGSKKLQALVDSIPDPVE